MRIVAVADTHTFEDDLDVPDGDVFVHAGDLLRSGTLHELDPVAKWLRALPHRHKIVVAGNHDGCFERDPVIAKAMLGSCIYLQDTGIEIEGVRFWGSPWQPRYADWWFNLRRGAPLAEKWALIPAKTDVLITHGPPFGIGDRARDDGWHSIERVGCTDLLARVRATETALHLFGHTHAGGGVYRDGNTVYANVTTDECERAPTVLDYDPVTRTVTEVVTP